MDTQQENNQKMIDSVLEGLRTNYPTHVIDYRKQRRSAFVNASRKKDKPIPVWSKEGLAIAFVKVRLTNTDVEVVGDAYKWPHTTKHAGTKFSFLSLLKPSCDITQLQEVEKQQLFTKLLAYIEREVRNDQEDIYLPIVHVSLSFGPEEKQHSRWDKPAYVATIETTGKSEWMETLQGVFENMQDAKKAEHLHIYNNMKNVFDSLYVHLLHYDLAKMLDLLKRFERTQIGAFNGDMMLKEMGFLFETDAKQLLSYKGIQDLKCPMTTTFTPLEVQYLKFAAQMIAKHVNDEWNKESQLFAAMLQKMLTKVVIKEETVQVVQAENNEEDVFDTYENRNVVLKAVYYDNGREDYFDEGESNRGCITCKIVNECEVAYKSALEQIMQWIKKGFPARFDFVLQAKAKNYTNIGDDVSLQNDSNQFFTNVCQYPSLIELMRVYVQVSSQHIAKLDDSQLEEDDSLAGRRADFVATAVLVLHDASGYDFLTTLNEFGKTVYVDQMVTGFHLFISAYLKQYGVNESNVANMVAALKQGQSTNLMYEVLEAWKDNENPEVKNIVECMLAYINQQQDSDKETKTFLEMFL